LIHQLDEASLAVAVQPLSHGLQRSRDNDVTMTRISKSPGSLPERCGMNMLINTCAFSSSSHNRARSAVQSGEDPGRPVS
jgi:hypothetical protein